MHKIIHILFFIFLCSPLSAHPTTEARAIINNAEILKNPNSAELYIQRGELHRQQHNFELAKQNYDKALTLGIDEVIYNYHLGLIHQDKLQHNQAQLYFEKALSHNQNFEAPIYFSLAQLGLAETYALQQRWLLAAKNYELVINQATKTDSSIFLMAAHYYQKAGSQYLASALNVLNLGLETFDGDLCMNKMAIEINLTFLNWHAAVSRINHMLQKYPKLLNNQNLLNDLNCNFSPSNSF